ncbi:hypothetical protein ONS95_002115 [Cadophora gregata]|uniref:uncharacterized protein n=1 Tax=Cadophora gregata TaxID=51156 RepID=UPI0026DB51CE|nr:uncharacterized protein ONS95_002115 [Cadophora gregata]KAK0109418.1 hypothetical protein ONS95_002115 [Cadophora gregata]
MTSSAAKLPTQDAKNEALCTFCLGINIQSLKSSIGYEHQPNFASLVLSSSTCPLCELITQSVKRTLNRNRVLMHSLSDDLGPVRLISAGRSLAPKTKANRVCPEGPVDEFLLLDEIAVAIGEELVRKRCFSSFGAQLVMVAAKGSAAEAAGVQAGQLNDRYALSENNIQRISELLKTCCLNHNQCSSEMFHNLSSKHHEKYGNFGLPSRLIDVMMEDQSKVRLVDVQGRHEYIALSYCWGKSQRLVTTKDNLAQIQMGIEISCFAKAIQDAVLFTRKLKTRHLWVDALCIIQKGDNYVDWACESQKMALIYGQSYLTIAAASTKGSDESFLDVPRSPRVACPFRGTPNSDPSGELFFSIPFIDFAEDFESGTYGSHLATRGWVKQERLCSRRTVHFTTRKMYWECRSTLWAETGEICKPLFYDGSKQAATYSRGMQLLRLGHSSTNNAGITNLFLSIWSEVGRNSPSCS